MKPYRFIEVHRVGGALGAEIRGVDLAAPVPPAVFDEIYRAWLENHVIYFRDQHIGPAEHLAFGTRFGDIHVHPFNKGLEEHPETQRKALYFGSHTERFDNMTEQESDPLLEFLTAHATRPEFTFRHRWEVGTLTVWDNRCCQHLAVNDYHGFRRRMHKITIAGDVPV